VEEQTKQPVNESNLEQSDPLKGTLLTSPEGRLLVAGATLAFVYIFWLGIKLLYSPEESQLLIGITATGLLFGRATAMAFGYTMEMGHSTVIPICIIIETILVLIFYPLFVFSWRHLLVIKSLKNIFERTQKSAEKHKEKVQRYGVIGLFLFVWFPFWMTGPVVGSVIGFLLGLKVWLNMTVVLAGTCAAIFGWAFFLRQLHEQVASHSSYAAMILTILLIVVVIMGHLLHRTLRNNKNKS
jgi:uncharacterized membrane protein